MPRASLYRGLRDGYPPAAMRSSPSPIRPARRGPRRPPGRLSRRGFSLVEILVALSIGAFAFFPILSMFQSGLRLTVQQSYWAQARQIAEKNMDEILALPFPDIPAGTNNVKVNGQPFPRRVEIKNTPYKVDVQVAVKSPTFTYRMRNLVGEVIPPMGRPPREYEAKDEVKEIRVTVSWKGVGATLEFPLVTCKADLHL